MNHLLNLACLFLLDAPSSLSILLAFCTLYVLDPDQSKFFAMQHLHLHLSTPDPQSLWLKLVGHIELPLYRCLH